MPWTTLASTLWNLTCALVGGFIGGIVTAYAIGRWRGEIEQRLHSLSEWRRTVEERLERGDHQLVNIPVVESKIQEIFRTNELIRDDLRAGFAQVERQLERTYETFVTRDECNRQHRRTAKA